MGNAKVLMRPAHCDTIFTNANPCTDVDQLSERSNRIATADLCSSLIGQNLCSVDTLHRCPTKLQFRVPSEKAILSTSKDYGTHGVADHEQVDEAYSGV